MKKFLTLAMLICTMAIAHAQSKWSVTLAWDPNPAGDQVDHYSLYRADNGTTNFVKIADIPATDPQQYTDLVPQSALVCLYYITASNLYIESDPSDVVGFNPVFPRKPSPLHVKSVQFAP